MARLCLTRLVKSARLERYSPLTAEGERGIQELGIGLRESGLQFDRAYSSDSGRTIQTMGIILEELGLQGKIPYRMDKRIREMVFW